MNRSEQQFLKQQIQERVSEKLGSNYVVQVNEVMKVNCTLDGISIRTCDTNIASNIYLNSYYRELKEGIVDLDQVAENIIDVYKKSRTDIAFDAEEFTNFESVRSRICSKLISATKNTDLLVDVPHIIFADDLAIVFYVLLDHFADGTASILIHNNHLQLWNTSVEEISELAIQNNHRINPSILQSMGQVMKEILICNMSGEMGVEPDAETLEELSEQLSATDEKMFVLSCKSKTNGAIYATDINILERFCDEHDVDRVIIIGSSVHEVLLIIPDENENTYDMYNDMVVEVNQMLETSDYLSDHVYLYRKGSETVVSIY